MGNNVYLVLEFDSELINIPFPDILSVDEFTQFYDNPLELVAALDDYLELGIPREEILDAYLASSLYNIKDDSQEFTDRALSIKYRRDIFDKEDLKKKLIGYLNGNLLRLREFSGMEEILTNYRKKRGTTKPISASEVEAVALIYLEDSYKRRKRTYYQLKDNGIRTKINEYPVDYSKTTVEQEMQDEVIALRTLTGMKLDDLISYAHKQLTSGRAR